MRKQPGKRLEQIKALLIDTDLPFWQIALKLGQTVGYVGTWAGHIYKRHGVHSRAELRALLRPPIATANAAG